MRRWKNDQTLLSVVPDEQFSCVAATRCDILGDLDGPNSGVAFVLPVERIVGMRATRPKTP